MIFCLALTLVCSDAARSRDVDSQSLQARKEPCSAKTVASQANMLSLVTGLHNCDTSDRCDWNGTKCIPQCHHFDNQNEANCDQPCIWENGRCYNEARAPSQPGEPCRSDAECAVEGTQCWNNGFEQWDRPTFESYRPVWLNIRKVKIIEGTKVPVVGMCMLHNGATCPKKHFKKQADLMATFGRMPTALALEMYPSDPCTYISPAGKTEKTWCLDNPRDETGDPMCRPLPRGPNEEGD